MSDQGRKDAMADAETLSRVCHEAGRGYRVVREWIAAANYGHRALDALAGRNIDSAGSLEADCAAEQAASAAFRAVPGLRA